MGDDPRLNLKTIAIVGVVLFILIALAATFAFPSGPTHTTSTLDFQQYQYPGFCLIRGNGWSSSWPGSC